MKNKKQRDEDDDELILKHLQNRDFNSLYDYCSDRNMVQEYQEVIYLEKPYRIGDDVMCTQEKNYKNSTIFGKVKNIAVLLIQPTHLPIVEIQEYIDRHQLAMTDIHLEKHEIEGLSEVELFLTLKTTWIFINDLDTKIKVLSLKEYEETPEKDENTYFTRATINEDKIVTDPLGWYTICVCKKLSNPDCAYVQCDKCKIWMHDDCAKVDVRNIKEEDDDFFCPKCVPSSKSQKKKKR